MNKLHGLATLYEDAVKGYVGDCSGLIRVIFEDMDPVWLRTMWEDGVSAHADMIEILISLALLKLKSRL
jgi:hypothetical protein